MAGYLGTANRSGFGFDCLSLGSLGVDWIDVLFVDCDEAFWSMTVCGSTSNFDELLAAFEGNGKYEIEVSRYINEELGINEQRIAFKTLDPDLRKLLEDN